MEMQMTPRHPRSLKQKAKVARKVTVKARRVTVEKGRKMGCLAKVRIRMPVQDLLSKVKEIASDQQRYATVDCATILLEPVDFET